MHPAGSKSGEVVARSADDFTPPDEPRCRNFTASHQVDATRLTRTFTRTTRDAAHPEHDPSPTLTAHVRLPFVLMKARTLRRSGRSWSSTGAVLSVLLAALLHVLACAHGVKPTATDHAHNVVSASVVHHNTYAVDRAQGGHRHASAVPQEAHLTAEEPPGHGHGCCLDEDEPTAQPTRTTVPAPDSDAHTLQSRPADATPPLRQSEAPAFEPSGAAHGGQSRSRLGVWRT